MTNLNSRKIRRYTGNHYDIKSPVGVTGILLNCR